MHSASSMHILTARKNLIPYSLFDVCGLCQTVLAQCAARDAFLAHAKSPCFIGFLRRPTIEVPGAGGRTFRAPSSMPTMLRDRGTSCICADRRLPGGQNRARYPLSLKCFWEGGSRNVGAGIGWYLEGQCRSYPVSWTKNRASWQSWQSLWQSRSSSVLPRAAPRFVQVSRINRRDDVTVLRTRSPR